MNHLVIMLMIVAGLISAYPLFYMMLLFFAQFGSSSLEFLFISCFWLGFISVVMFARNCAVAGFEKPKSYWLLALALIGVVGGLGEEVLLLDNTKLPISYGFFELATGPWLLVGLATCMLPNPSLNPDAEKSRAG